MNEANMIQGLKADEIADKVITEFKGLTENARAEFKRDLVRVYDGIPLMVDESVVKHLRAQVSGVVNKHFNKSQQEVENTTQILLGSLLRAGVQTIIGII